MDKLSELIKEAKPLYKQRKRRKTIAKLIVLTSMPMMMLTSVCHMYFQGNDIYLSLKNNSLQNELIEDEFGLLGHYTIEEYNQQ